MNPIFKFAVREDLSDTGGLFLPKKGEPNATGYDVRAAMIDRKDLVIKPGQYFKIPLGFRAMPEEGWWFELHPRSSSFAKKFMHVLIGIIDCDFSSSVMFAGQYIPDSNSMNPDLVIKFGDAIGQIIPVKRVDMGVVEISNKVYDDLCASKNAVRKGMGFGSTDELKSGFIKFGDSNDNYNKILKDLEEKTFKNIK